MKTRNNYLDQQVLIVFIVLLLLIGILVQTVEVSQNASYACA